MGVVLVLVLGALAAGVAAWSGARSLRRPHQDCRCHAMLAWFFGGIGGFQVVAAGRYLVEGTGAVGVVLPLAVGGTYAVVAVLHLRAARAGRAHHPDPPHPVPRPARYLFMLACVFMATLPLLQLLPVWAFLTLFVALIGAAVLVIARQLPALRALRP